jgi:hypothetical protein
VSKKTNLSLGYFACVADAIAAAEKLSTKMKWHQLDHIQTVEKPHYAKRCKPQPDAIPTSISYRVTATVRPIDSEILPQRQRCGRFVTLSTSIPAMKIKMVFVRFIAILWRAFGLVYAIFCVPFAVFTKSICISM